jgi:hypothetical protein
MATTSQNREEDICISEIESNPTTYQDSLNSSIIEFISKAVQAQLSAILPNMIQEITKSHFVEGEIQTVIVISRLATGSTQCYEHNSELKQSLI